MSSPPDGGGRWREVDHGPRSPSLTITGRARRILPFVVVTALTFPLALIGRSPDDSLWLVALAAVVILATTAAIVLLPWGRLPHGPRITLVIAYCIGIGMLRHSGGGATAGYGGLLLLPIINQAVYARWRDVVAAIVCTSSTLMLPILVFGAPQYPVSEWRRVILSTMTFTLAGLVVNRLIHQVSRQQRMFARVLEVTRSLDGPDVATTVCRAVLQATEADVVTYHELDRAGRVQPVARVSADDLAADGPEAAPATAPHADAPAAMRDAIEAGRATYTADTGEPVRSVLHQPVLDGDDVQGVITVGWCKVRRKLPTEDSQVVELLASEAAVATERVRLMAQLDRLAHHDQLTGVFNRLAWDGAFATELARVERTGEEASLALLDLDHFKDFNDEHGHLAGDQLLVESTQRWLGELRTIDVLARWGGEEFVLLLPATGLAAAHGVLARLRAAMPDGQSFSAGLVPVRGRSAVDLLRSADAALYRAKDQGRGRTEVVGLDAAARAALRTAGR